MGQKVSPHGLRVGVIKDWDSKWYADKKNFADYLVEDNQIREFVKKKLYAAGISKILIDRQGEDKLRVTISTGRPGMVIGRDGDGIDALKKDLMKLTKKNVEVEIKEIRRAELDAQLTAESIAQALERRVSFRRAMKQALQRTMKAGAKGIKIVAAGRLGGAEIARSEKYSEGNVPLHTLRADIDYACAEADTTYGRIGIKVWINHGRQKTQKRWRQTEKRRSSSEKRRRQQKTRQRRASVRSQGGQRAYPQNSEGRGTGQRSRRGSGSAAGRSRCRRIDSRKEEQPC